METTEKINGHPPERTRQQQQQQQPSENGTKPFLFSALFFADTLNDERLAALSLLERYGSCEDGKIPFRFKTLL